MKSNTQFYRLFEINIDSGTSGSIPFDCSSSGNFLEELRDVVLAPEWTWKIKRVFRKEYSYK